MLIACLVPALAAPGSGQKSKPSFALIAGTVFRNSGFSLPGAEVTVDPDPGAGPPARLKRIRVRTDARGEFAVRVPPAPMRYNVSVRAREWQGQQKTVSVQGEERIDLSFVLSPASK